MLSNEHTCSTTPVGNFHTSVPPNFPPLSLTTRTCQNGINQFQKSSLQQTIKSTDDHQKVYGWYLSLIVHDKSTNAYTMGSICRNAMSSFRNPVHKHQVIWFGMVEPEPFLLKFQVKLRNVKEKRKNNKSERETSKINCVYLLLL